MPEKMKSHHSQKRNYGYNKYDNGSNVSPSQFNPNYNQNQMIQITSIADLAALSGSFGGFNPNKYMTPVPMGFNPNMNGFGNMPPHMMYQQQMQMQMYQQPMANGQPMPFGNQTPGNSTPSNQSKYPKTGSPSKNGQRYEKKDKNSSSQKSGKKGEKTEPKKYVTKQKKDKNEDSPAKSSSDKKPVENVASAWAQKVSEWYPPVLPDDWILTNSVIEGNI